MATGVSIAGVAQARAHARDRQASASAGIGRSAIAERAPRPRDASRVAHGDADRSAWRAPRPEPARRIAQELDARAGLPWPYVAILVAEVAVLAGLAAGHPGRPPWTYEMGWAGCGSMLVMQLYSVRRRVRALRHLGSLRGWLDAHAFLGLQGFVLVAYHSIGVSPSASLAAINFALVATVVITGLVGRYLYSLIPRARASEVRAYAELGAAVLRDLAPPRACRGLCDLIGGDLARRRLLRRLLRDPAMTPGRAREVRRSVTLASRISALEVADRWFSRWTLFHRPLALLLLALTTLHALAHFAYAA